MALGSAARVEEGRGDELALTDGARTLTWRQLDRDLNRAANALLAMDLGGERRVAVFARNAVETLELHYATHLAGVSPVPSISNPAISSTSARS